MKKIFFIILSVFSLSFLNVYAEETITDTIENTNEEISTIQEEIYVASVDNEKFTSFDEALKYAVDNKIETITLLLDAEAKGINISQNITVEGNNHTLSFNEKGIALFGSTLTFNNTTIEIKGVGSTPYGEWNWQTISASKNANLILNNSKMTLDGKGTNSNVHAIYFGSNNKLNLTNSTLIIKNYNQDALEWDGGNGGYNVNLTNSTYISDHNRSGFTGTFYATFDNSTVKVLNSAGNGSNGTYYAIKNNSNVTFENNGTWGISAWRIDMTDNSTLTANNNGYSGIWTRVLNVDSTCKLYVTENGKKATTTGTNAGIIFFGNGKYSSTIEKGAEVIIKNNAGSGIFTKQKVCNLTILSGEITNNGTGLVNANNLGADLGGGIYNIGTMIIGEDVNIYNNHASLAADDIYNAEGATITFEETKEDWVLDDCNDKINAWYDDSDNNRWNAHTDEEDKLHTEKVKSGSVESKLTIKAAHNLKAKVIAHYVDQDGNKIADDEIINGYVDDTYKTIQKLIEGYEFDKVEGNTEGIMTIKDIEVTYIYEFVKGEGDGEDPEEPKKEEKPYTGVYTSSLNIIPFALSLSLGSFLVLNRKKLIKEN
mgnify:FL=1